MGGYGFQDEFGRCPRCGNARPEGGRAIPGTLMTALNSATLILALALAIDRLIGDPPWLWQRVTHPIAAMGLLVSGLDRRLNKPGYGFEDSRRRGIVALAIGVLAAAAVGILLTLVLDRLPLGWAIEAIVVAVFLAQKSLVEHVTAVEHGLVSGGVDAGRRAVAKIVGRDVALLDEASVARAAIESAAESFSDAIVAPAFWYLLLGLPGLLVYKLVNTADSMIGNRSPRHIAFGWAAARFDDLLNLAPARLSALIIAATAALMRNDARSAWDIARRDAPKHRSPNAGWPEAALAGALGLALGGPRRYGAEEVDGAWLNPGARSTATPHDISAAIRLIDAAWALLVILTALAATIALSFAR
jgi:adenosylcobinamide-phosphate synthase